MEEYNLIRNAPVISGILIFLGGAIAYGLARLRYKGIVDIQNQRINQLESLMVEFRERLESSQEYGKKYAQMTRAELKAKTLSFVGKLRDFKNEYIKEEKNIGESVQHLITNTQTDEERNRVLNAERDRLAAKLFSKCIDEYEKRYKDDAIVLCTKLLSCLPEEVKDSRKCNDAIYDSPPSIVCIGWIADELAIWAKKLH